MTAVNRKLLVVVVVAAVLALVAGAAVGRSLLSSSTPTAAPRADVVRFKDTVARVSIAYPASWQRLPQRSEDPDLALLAAADDSTSLLMRDSLSGLDVPVTRKTLPIVRKYTDGLVSADRRAKQLTDPVAVVAGGLPGWRYRYTFGSGATGGAHDHYFLFKGGRLIQLVFQAVPAERLPAVASVFDSIAASFRGHDS
ncbi:MAG: hypothetical protein QOG56_1137 [Solirubrobacteraceae bacterium]|nr:hypothetical protein [Solirubrobacteraceae bacterium]